MFIFRRYTVTSQFFAMIPCGDLHDGMQTVNRAEG